MAEPSRSGLEGDGLSPGVSSRHKAYVDDVAARMGFDTTEDKAALIARYFVAQRNRCHRDRFDPVLAPIIERAEARYAELRRYDFEFAAHASDTEAVRAILAMDLPGLDERAPAVPQAILLVVVVCVVLWYALDALFMLAARLPAILTAVLIAAGCLAALRLFSGPRRE